MRTRIPLWINVLQVVILAILAFQTYAMYFDPNLLFSDLVVDASTEGVVYSLAGRNAVMMTISVVALVLQNPRFYSFAFVIHILRDVQDMFIAPQTGAPTAVFFVFLFVFVIPEILAFAKLTKLANEPKVEVEA